MLKKFINFTMCVLLAFSLALPTLACKTKDKGGSKAGTVKLFINGGNDYDGVKKDSIWEKIEENTGLTMKIEGAAHNSDYYTTLNPIINTGRNVADVVFMVPSSSGNAYNNFVNQDIFWNIDELIAQRPGEFSYIEKLLTSAQYKNITYGDDSKHTLIPLLTSNSGWGIYYRTDWLKNVGFVDEGGVAKTPNTIEEFQEVLKLFTENDPDKNGKKDTYGLSPHGETFYLNPLYHAFGVCAEYDLQSDGSATYMYLQNEFKDFLNWFKKMFDNGYIDPTFNINNNAQDRDAFYEGKTGILITNAEQHITWIAEGFENQNGKNKLAFGNAPVGTKNLGKEGSSGFTDWGGWWGGFSITKTSANPFEALKLLNYLYSPEGSILRSYGIEGTHYNKVGEEYEPIIDGRNNETANRFSTSKDAVSGNILPTGYYKLGASFGYPLDWTKYETEHKIKVKIDCKALDNQYYDLIQDGVNKNNLHSSKLVNVTGYYSSYTTKMKKIQDECNTYALNAILGAKNTTSDWDKLLTTVNTSAYGWKNIKAMLEELAKNLGIEA